MDRAFEDAEEEVVRGTDAGAGVAGYVAWADYGAVEAVGAGGADEGFGYVLEGSVRYCDL